MDWMSAKRMNLVWRMPIGSHGVEVDQAMGLEGRASSRRRFEDEILSGYLRYAGERGIEGMRHVGWQVDEHFREAYPRPYFRSSWLDFESKWQVHPDHPIFPELIRTQMRLFNEREGGGHGWGLGWYPENVLRHEDNHQMSADEQAQMLQALARKASEAVLEADPAAYGLMGDSTFISGPQCNAARARAFFEAFAPGFEMMVYGV